MTMTCNSGFISAGFLGKAGVGHVGLGDPPKLAKTAANDDGALSRDELRQLVAEELGNRLAASLASRFFASFSNSLRLNFRQG
jgi:hypothetical protein